MTRPAIPADIRRRVLLEAGHRCAIHTCRHPATDVHHIIPWSQSEDHSYENLIALCPNCHRRADAGEIDRQSLLAYKARLLAEFHFEEAKPIHDHARNEAADDSFSGRQGWITRTVRETTKEGLHYGLHVEYPELIFSEFEVNEVNIAIAGIALKEVQEFRGDVLLQGRYVAGAKSPESVAAAHLGGSFSFLLLCRRAISLRLTFGSYAWGAHGSHWNQCVNLLLSPVRWLDIGKLFENQANGLPALATFCQRRLLEEGRDEISVLHGANATKENFHCFNLTPDGVLVTFREYQVGSYAEGPAQVLWPSREAARYVIPEVLALF